MIFDFTSTPSLHRPTTEPRLDDLIRRGKIDPLPELSHGRRRWAQTDIERAASALVVECPDLGQLDALEVSRG